VGCSTPSKMAKLVGVCRGDTTFSIDRPQQNYGTR
jgi:hypothetical protein